MEKYNSKTKLYPDGQKNTVFASKSIFPLSVHSAKAKLFLVKALKPKQKSFSVVSLFEFPPSRFRVKKIRHISKSRVKSNLSDSHREKNQKRAHDRVFDLVYCNDFKWFLSVTFNPDIVDSYDVPVVMKKVNVWLQNKVRRSGLKYILIPEYHTSGRVHCHLLTNDVFVMQSSGKYSMGTDGQKHEIFNVLDWKFGFSTAIKIYGAPIHAACYLTKYITKQNQMIFGRYYWSSRNLVRSPEIQVYNTPFQVLELDEVQTSCPGLKLKYYNEMRWDKW